MDMEKEFHEVLEDSRPLTTIRHMKIRCRLWGYKGPGISWFGIPLQRHRHKLKETDSGSEPKVQTLPFQTLP